MQFTERSELNRIIGLTRMAACNSPTFHDRQDSEVDRIYNSSPKMEAQMRNSWIDKMASFKTMPVTVKKVSSASERTASVSSNGPTSSGASRKQSGAENPDTASKKDGQDTSRPKADSNAQTSRRKSSTKGFEGRKDGEKRESGGLVFEKEEVEPLSLHSSSTLDKVLKGATAQAGLKSAPLGGDGSVLHLIIYLPTRSEMKIDLYDSSTVDESIQEILRTHQTQQLDPPLYYGHPECYELRLHDADGYPDEDFPALDRSRKIKNFGDAGGHEYCLCERPDACPPNGDAPPESNPTLSSSKSDSSMSNKPAAASEKSFLKIFMPKSDDYTVVAIDSTTTGQDLLPTLNKKHRLQLFQDQYVLKISESERERLDLPTGEVDLRTKLHPLNLHEVTLATKQYADAPQVPVTVTNTVDDPTNVDGRQRPPPETFMFNDVTAAMFKEWRVNKKNKYGKWQQRMLGIDLNKVYNRKVGERVIKSRNTTKVAERPISNVAWVQFKQAACDFQVYYKDEDTVTDYIADSPYECAEIVAKLKYILSRRA